MIIIQLQRVANLSFWRYASGYTRDGQPRLANRVRLFAQFVLLLRNYQKFH